MTNEMKLLKAFIEASGFDVEEGDVTAGNLIDNRKSSAVYSTKEINQLYPGKHIECPTFGGNWVVSEPIADYKVTKKKSSRDNTQENLSSAYDNWGKEVQ